MGEKDLIGEKTVSTYRGNGIIILFGVGSGESIIFWEDHIDLVCPGLRLGTERSPRRRPHSRRYSAMWWRLTARRPRTRSLVGIPTQNLFGIWTVMWIGVRKDPKLLPSPFQRYSVLKFAFVSM